MTAVWCGLCRGDHILKTCELCGGDLEHGHKLIHFASCARACCASNVRQRRKPLNRKAIQHDEKT